MKTTNMIIPILIAIFIALVGCRKEDAEPYYNYIGGTAQPTADETADEESSKPPSGNDVDLAADQEKTELQYDSIDFGTCNKFIIPMGKGVLDSKSEWEAIWSTWCPNSDIPNVDFEQKIVFYYFATPGLCEDILFKGAHIDGQNAIIEIEKEVQKPEGNIQCMCPLILKKKHFLYTLERVPGEVQFKETTVEIPCKM